MALYELLCFPKEDLTLSDLYKLERYTILHFLHYSIHRISIPKLKQKVTKRQHPSTS